MEPTQIYGVVAGGMLLSLFLYRSYLRISNWIQDRTLFYIFKYLIYPLFFRRRVFLGPVTRGRFTLVFVYWLGTAFCNVIGVKTWSQASSRAGVLSVLHLIPLLFSTRLSFAADLLGLSLKSYIRFHGVLGHMAFWQGLAHVLFQTTHNVFRIRDTLQFYGLLAAIPFAIIMLLLICRHPFYEFFEKTHFFLALILVFAIWQHLTRSRFTSFYIIMTVCPLLSTTFLRYVHIIFRSMAWNRLYAVTNLVSINDAIRAEIEITRPWKVKAGEYIYICIPGVGPLSIFQSHPFMITWWDEDDEGRCERVHLLLKPKAGFTRQLMRHVLSPDLKTWIDGPYGDALKFEDVGRTVMFASGIGIAAQIPYIKELLAKVKDWRVCTRKIILVWLLDKESDQDWVQDWMDQLLAVDEGGYILHIELYVLRQFVNPHSSYGDQTQYGEHLRVRKLYGKPVVEDLVKREIDRKEGRLLITTCVESELQDRIHSSVEKHFKDDVRLIHLDFEPGERRSFWSPKLTEVGYQGNI